jgi:hypothetical protein
VTRTAEIAAERVVGASIEHAEVRPDGLLVVVFSHRGTDDDGGYMIVPPSCVHFNDGGDPDAWKQDAA